ncbi:hypothetical protein NE237_002921 [Protea cynaroides]|uniref:Uncharacterized protein n=1 Tax=Protea cynaroides TaxID=273540 RepID=A0A9Q0QS35_9MAGN|nr:hypothetical protein NE237_002921 [Protea cynaroides]
MVSDPGFNQNDQEQPHRASCPNPMEPVQVNLNVASPTSKSILHSTDLGRWADVDDGDDEDEENEEGEIPIENMDLNEVPESEDPTMIDISNVQGANGVLIPTIAESIPVVNDVPSHGVESDLPLPVATGASMANASIITSSPGRVEVSFADVMSVDESLFGHGGDFIIAGKRPSSRTSGRGKKQGDQTSMMDARQSRLQSLRHKCHK